MYVLKQNLYVYILKDALKLPYSVVIECLGNLKLFACQ